MKSRNITPEEKREELSKFLKKTSKESKKYYHQLMETFVDEIYNSSGHKKTITKNELKKNKDIVGVAKNYYEIDHKVWQFLEGMRIIAWHKYQVRFSSVDGEGTWGMMSGEATAQYMAMKKAIKIRSEVNVYRKIIDEAQDNGYALPGRTEQLSVSILMLPEEAQHGRNE